MYEEGSRKPIVHATIYVLDNKVGTVTNEQGYFTLSVPVSASLKVRFSFVGFSSIVQTISLAQDTKLDIYLAPGEQLNEQTVRATKAGSVSNEATMSTISITGAQLRKIPALFGEKDPLKMLQLMPGVQKGSEGNAGLYVRGGSPDGNLILLDDAPIYNPNHLLGFFSAFNGDVLKRVDLTKGGFPARFGGRLSSVVELSTKDGGSDKLHGEGSLGLVASRLTLQGPLLSPKVSFLVSGRRTYLDLLSGLIQNSNSAQPATKSYFYDLNAKVTVDAGVADKVSLSAYTSQDQFFSVREAGATPLRSGLNWANLAGSARWSHRFAGGTTSTLSLIYSQYKMGVSDQQSLSPAAQNQLYTLQYQSGIRDLGLKYDINQYISDKHQFQYGIQATNHQFTPKATITSAQDTLPQQASTQTINALEAGVYGEHYWQPTDRLRINSGLRLSYYSVLGTSANPAVGTKSYIKPEPRLSVAYKVSSTMALKGSYALMNQYVHLLSSTGIGLATDLWMPTVDHIKPQQSQQIALGLAKDLPASGLTFTAEGYYKQMQNLLSYREGASFVSTNAQGAVDASNWTNNVTNGQGWSYGVELMLQKRVGRLSGWLGYTLSWTQWQFAELNGGKRFNPRYDRRHDASAVLIYELTPSITLAGTWVYGTGNALTMPLSRYSGFTNNTQASTRPSAALLYGDGPNVKEYGDRNSFRAAPYHRLDISLQFNKKKAHYERTWELSVYNVYNRSNAFLYSLEGKDQGKDLPSKTVLYKYSLFPIVPTVSYAIRF
ncbi:TonB-dependent receptor [Spirosoma humi]